MSFGHSITFTILLGGTCFRPVSDFPVLDVHLCSVILHTTTASIRGDCEALFLYTQYINCLIIELTTSQL